MANFKIEKILEVKIAEKIGQCRACPVNLGPERGEAILLAHGPDFDVDPWTEMFYFPTDTLKLTLMDLQGKILWTKDLGKGVIPGVWFCPVYAFDLDGDGVDEIWFVNNTKTEHPISIMGMRLQRLDALTGEPTGDFDWCYKNQGLGINAHRHFIGGARVHGKPVLFTANGTYGDMHLHAWDPGMNLRWEKTIGKSDPGARGSHMLTFVDLNNDGADELIWGERAISMDTGTEIFCADRDVYSGHSDINQPFFDYKSGKWFLHTCRESQWESTPRVVCFDDQGKRVWGDLDAGHIDMGWIGRLGDNYQMVANAVKVDGKSCGAEGRFHTGIHEYNYVALTGEKLDYNFSTYKTLPIDVNGDGYHELVRGGPGGDGELMDRHGNSIAQLGAATAMVCKFMNLPGEQLLCYYPDGTIAVWADTNAVDNDIAKARYAHPYYQTNRKVTAVGYNLMALGGI